MNQRWTENREIINKILQIFTIFLVSLCFCQSSYANINQSFTVKPLSSYTLSGTLYPGDVLQFHFTVEGTNNYVDFKIIDPSGNEIINEERINEYDYTFIAWGWGQYEFEFDNSFSIISSKKVNLTYNTITNILLIGLIFLVGSLISLFIYRRIKRIKTKANITTPVQNKLS